MAGPMEEKRLTCLPARPTHADNASRHDANHHEEQRKQAVQTKSLHDVLLQVPRKGTQDCRTHLAVPAR